MERPEAQNGAVETWAARSRLLRAAWPQAQVVANGLREACEPGGQTPAQTGAPGPHRKPSVR